MEGADRRVIIGWLMIGFALGGFFDGILLHQVLQWHHLLSGLDDPANPNLPLQVLADGIFHLLMYVVAIIGTALVVRARKGQGAFDRTPVLKLALFGFGAWHVVDALLSHWLLGIHRIRMDSDDPLLWDLGWLAVFGLLPLLIGWCLPRGGSGRPVAASVLAFLIASGLAASIGPALTGPQETIVVFRSGVSEDEKMAALMNVGGNLRWSDASGAVWGISDVPLPGMLALYRSGAALVSSTPALAGCLAFTRRA